MAIKKTKPRSRATARAFRKAPTRKIRKNNSFDGIKIDKLNYFSCKYIIRSEKTDKFYCGKEIHKISYCKNHYELCYIVRPN